MALPLPPPSPGCHLANQPTPFPHPALPCALATLTVLYVLLCSTTVIRSTPPPPSSDLRRVRACAPVFHFCPSIISPRSTRDPV
ncbi:hypothetical protein BCV70DRAFT_116468 [Testicularia cyperi]|uniref:Uncharacterized protein n=1 Tax=Testicularia cyperi TaxID=1882483 RepID=A0A317XLX1_9BASI|nr:hypothetical protein BCV70DRAFT_116468 [Testicularia cyperi]